MDYLLIEDANQKQDIARKILEALPEWFGIEDSREEYIRDSAKQLCFGKTEFQA